MSLTVEPLTRAAFAPFGDVVETDDARAIHINQGFAERHNDLANVDVTLDGGRTNVSIFTARPRPLPIEVRLMERHPLASQLFAPMQDRPWLVLVCADPRDKASYRAFRATGAQGVNYARNVWHHPLLVLEPSLFLVVDRKGPGHNLEEYELAEREMFTLIP